MRTDNSIIIRAKSDTCNVSVNSNSHRILIGSVTIESDEAADFAQTLATVLAQITAPNKEEKP